MSILFYLALACCLVVHSVETGLPSALTFVRSLLTRLIFTVEDDPVAVDECSMSREANIKARMTLGPACDSPGSDWLCFDLAADCLRCHCECKPPQIKHPMCGVVKSVA
jgi:hypothetical protein